MLYAFLPVGSFHGWGVCGKYLVKEFSRLGGVRLVTQNLAQAVNDPFELRLLQACEVERTQYEAIRSGRTLSLDHPVLHAIADESMRPSLYPVRGTKTHGYTFFERNILPREARTSARRLFDRIITGSTWCEEVLRDNGFTEVRTILQGIDATLFHARENAKEYFRDEFVVFSGGKFELRKGQDLVIRAYKTLQDRHADVMLVNSWCNQWPDSVATMAQSRHIRFSALSGSHEEAMTRLLADNGIDTGRVITLPLMVNVMMPRIYRNTDVGLFPNRCEGGTNLVMMEYMACGRPVVASFNSGHRDVLTERNSVRTMTSRKIDFLDKGSRVGVWDEPDLEEVTERLEWAYQNRDTLRTLGDRAARDMAELTWERCARLFLESFER